MENNILTQSELERVLREQGINPGPWVRSNLSILPHDYEPVLELKLDEGITLSLYFEGTPAPHAIIESQRYPIPSLADTIAKLVGEAYALEVDLTRNDNGTPMQYFSATVYGLQSAVSAVIDMRAAQKDYDSAIKNLNDFARTLIPKRN